MEVRAIEPRFSSNLLVRPLGVHDRTVRVHGACRRENCGQTRLLVPRLGAERPVAFASAKKVAPRLWPNVLRFRRVPLELAVEGLAIEAEDLCRERPVASHALEHAEQVPALHLVERHELSDAVALWRMRGPARPEVLRQVVDGDRVVAGEGHGMLDAVLELAHVARPGVGEETLGDLRRETRDRLAGTGGAAID